jgi:hypothetical protein
MKTAWKIASLGSAAALLAACSHTVEREVIRQPVQETPPTHVTVVEPPSAPQDVMQPAPAPTGYSWIPGHYVWRNSDWAWENGHWVAGTVRAMPPTQQETIPTMPYTGARWIPGYWNYASGDWVWVRGHWQ